MEEIKEINVFTMGDSNLTKTWSNVPYFLTNTLEKRGFKINRINIAPNKYIKVLFNRTIFPLLNFFWKENIYTYDRTLLYYMFTNMKIWYFSKKFKSADLNISTNFSFLNQFSDKRNVLLCDWDIIYLISVFKKRTIYSIEKSSVDRQRKVIENADLVVSLFPKAASNMRSRYENKNIIHLDKNVVNVLYDGDINEKNIIEEKLGSDYILFVGAKYYKDGALLLIDTVRKLRDAGVDLKVKIIGMDHNLLSIKDDFVETFGYLNKDIKKDRDIYYKLMIGAKLFVNPTMLWGGYSSTIESMYFYTPIIIYPSSEFEIEFGKSVNFGKYIENPSIHELTKMITQILDSSEYESYCLNAHNSVRNYTWDNYIDALLMKINSLM